MNRFALPLAGALLLAGCSQSTGSTPAAPPPAPEPPAVLDPVGVYDYETTLEGQPMTGTMTITGTPGAYSGSISSDIGTIPLRNFVIDGMELSFIGDTPDATVTFMLVFDGSTFEGEWDAEGMMSGLITGTKR